MRVPQDRRLREDGNTRYNLQLHTVCNADSWLDRTGSHFASCAHTMRRFETFTGAFPFVLFYFGLKTETEKEKFK